jgi:L-asparaginase II
VPLAVSYRGPVVEAVHYGQVAAAWPSGKLAAALGDPEAATVLRSAAKPLQALSVVTSGAADRFQLEPRHLAIICASHQGSAAHLAVVREILERLRLDEGYLDCGVHWPEDREECDRLIRGSLSPSAIHNNCSGKHAGMLATALALGVPPRGYLDVAHPVQALIRRHLALVCDVPEAALVPLVDGCGAPTYALPLRRIATALARLARPDGLPEDLRQAAQRLTAAMAAHPEMVQGSGSFNTALLRETAGAVVAKGGAEGLFALGLAESGLGLAVKAADGSGRPWPPVVMALLQGQLSPLPPGLARWARPEQTNCHGTIVGATEPTEAVRELLPPHLRSEEACP